MILAVALIGMVVIGVCGLLGRRRPSGSLEEWTVGHRNFGTLVTWFLTAGEAFTTFTFLGVAGLAFAGGSAATYAIPYVPLGMVALYFVAPRVWRLSRKAGYLTQADFFGDRYGSPVLEKLVAAVGVVFLLPYLQLQITGLGLVVELVTGDKGSGDLSMVIATVLVIAFVLWSGIRGVANTAYLKDVLVLVAITVVVVAVPLHYAGGIGDVFSRLQAEQPSLLTVHAGPFDRTWWLTGILISAIGTGFLTSPHIWPSVLAAGGTRVLRRNFAWISLYQFVIILPVIVGFTAVLALPRGTNGNGVLLTVTRGALPDWLTGVVAVAAAAAAMVPAAALCIGISSLVARNLVPLRSERAQLTLNHLVVIVAAVVSLVFALAATNALADLLLLSFSGLAQLAPGLVAGLGRRVRLAKVPVTLGLLVGVGTLAWLSFGPSVDTGHVNEGLVALAANIVVAVVAQVLQSLFSHRPAGDADPRAQAASASSA